LVGPGFDPGKFCVQTGLGVFASVAWRRRHVGIVTSYRQVAKTQMEFDGMPSLKFAFANMLT